MRKSGLLLQRRDEGEGTPALMGAAFIICGLQNPDPVPHRYDLWIPPGQSRRLHMAGSGRQRIQRCFQAG